MFSALTEAGCSMTYVEANGDWLLFSPDKAPNLPETCGAEFSAMNVRAVPARPFPAQELWYVILESQIETGEPPMCYKNHADGKLLVGFSRQCLLFSQENPKERGHDQVV